MHTHARTVIEHSFSQTVTVRQMPSLFVLPLVLNDMKFQAVKKGGHPPLWSSTSRWSWKSVFPRRCDGRIFPFTSFTDRPTTVAYQRYTDRLMEVTWFTKKWSASLYSWGICPVSKRNISHCIQLVYFLYGVIWITYMLYIIYQLHTEYCVICIT